MNFEESRLREGDEEIGWLGPRGFDPRAFCDAPLRVAAKTSTKTSTIFKDLLINLFSRSEIL
jgi:hypothetical protein